MSTDRRLDSVRAVGHTVAAPIADRTAPPASLRRLPQGEVEEELRKHAAWVKEQRDSKAAGGVVGTGESPAQLTYLDLSKDWLRNLKLDRDSLKKANLTGCDLHGRDLTGKNLNDAILVGANLWDTKFVDACLQRADLTDAHGLLESNLAGADLCDAKLPEACLAF